MEETSADDRADGPDVFVCYSHQDTPLVSEEIAWLESQGVDVWFDEGISAGRLWRAEIAQAIDACTSFVFFISAASLESEHCNREVSLALEQSKFILPVYLEDVQLTDDLRLGLARVHALWKRDIGYRERLRAALDQGAASRMPETKKVASTRAAPGAAITLAVVMVIAAATLWLSKPRSDQSPEGPPLTSIAVMPFEDLSPDGDQAWLANGITDELFQSLSRVEALRVVGRSSTSTLKATGPAGIGTRLNVGSFVEGSVQRVGETLRVNVHWIRIDDQTQLWTARYDRTLDDMFAIQREMATGIAEAIRTYFGLDNSVFADVAVLRYQPTDIRAWQLFQQAIDTIARNQTVEGGLQAREFAREAIAIDPGFARPYSFLAWEPWFMRGDRDGALELIDEALARDPEDEFAHRVLASMELTDWNFSAAERRLDWAIEANPQAGLLLEHYVELLLKTGRIQEALRWAERRAELEPMVAATHRSLGAARLAAGDYGGAAESFQTALDLQGNQGPGARISLAVAYELAGREADALQVYSATVAPERVEALWEAHAQTGMAGVLLALANPGSCQAGMVGPATMYARAGAVDEMFACLEAAPIPSRPFMSDLPYLLHATTSLAPYRDDPRFIRLVERTHARIVEAEAAGPIRPIPDVLSR